MVAVFYIGYLVAWVKYARRRALDAFDDARRHDSDAREAGSDARDAGEQLFASVRDQEAASASVPVVKVRGKVRMPPSEF